MIRLLEASFAVVISNLRSGVIEQSLKLNQLIRYIPTQSIANLQQMSTRFDELTWLDHEFQLLELNENNC